MYLRKTSTINVYINIIYEVFIIAFIEVEKYYK